MGIFTKQIESEQKEKSELVLQGMKSLEENGFIAGEEKKELPEGYLDGKLIAFSNVYANACQEFSGSAEEQLAQFREFLKQKVIKGDIMRKRGKVYNYDIDSVMDITAFVMAFRDPDNENIMTCACIKEGIEITCKAAAPEKRDGAYAAGLMKQSLKEATDKIAENGNDYPVVIYDEENNELTAVIYVLQYFHKPQEVRGMAKVDGMFFGGMDSLAGLLPKKVDGIKYLKQSIRE